MKFIYIDESGMGEEPVAVMAGVCADSYRMRVTKEHWKELLGILSQIIGRQIKEIHTKDLYSGNSPWRELNGNKRSEIITAIFSWLQERKHSIVYTAVDKSKFNDLFTSDSYSSDISTLWRFMALHLTLSIQKTFQGSPRGRRRTINASGMSVLIFDNKVTEEKRFTDLLLNAPDWSDSYYEKKINQEKFGQIVDVPHFVDSKDVGLIQLADFICFFLRKHIELEMDIRRQDYLGEKQKVNNWANIIFSQAIPKNHIYKSRQRCSCASYFCKFAPEVLL